MKAERVADVSMGLNGVTWGDIKDLDPRLTRLEAVAAAVPSGPDALCHVARWYGTWDGERRRSIVGIKERLCRVVGWDRCDPGEPDIIEEHIADTEPEIVLLSGAMERRINPAANHPLGSRHAYDRAYEYLWTRMLPCRVCGLGISERESEIEQLLIDRLEAFGCEVQRQVPVAGGRADVVTDDAVYEVKRSITRVSLYAAIGQVVLYAAALGKPRKVVVGLRSGELISDLVAHAALAGVEVETW